MQDVIKYLDSHQLDVETRNLIDKYCRSVDSYEKEVYMDGFPCGTSLGYIAYTDKVFSRQELSHPLMQLLVKLDYDEDVPNILHWFVDRYSIDFDFPWINISAKIAIYKKLSRQSISLAQWVALFSTMWISVYIMVRVFAELSETFSLIASGLSTGLVLPLCYLYVYFSNRNKFLKKADQALEEYNKLMRARGEVEVPTWR